MEHLLTYIKTEYCHVVFVKSIEVRDLDEHNDSATDNSEDPFIDTKRGKEITKPKPLPSIASLGSKPLPPPTRPLKEMPTCPVCLERMDESTGLLTIPCQHTFHCDCLVKWRKNGCPVCRFSQDDIIHKGIVDDHEELNACSICASESNLWICLICGNIGCGRYDDAHAFMHWEKTGHSFSLDLTDQRIWDYASDAYVHRIMQNKIDGKMMELPSAAGDYDNEAGEEDVIPKAKFEAMGAEYTQLLMSQLDSQRTYYEQRLNATADKASDAQRSAERAAEAATQAVTQLSLVEAGRQRLEKEVLPSLERDRERADRHATKFEQMSRKMEGSWREEQAITDSLLEKTAHLEKEVEKVTKSLLKAEEKISELEDTNHDLMMTLSGREQISQMEDADVREGTLFFVNDNKNEEAPVEKKKKPRKKKNRGKGGRDEALVALGKKEPISGENSRSGTTTEAEDNDEEKTTGKQGKGKEREIIQIHDGQGRKEDKVEH